MTAVATFLRTSLMLALLACCATARANESSSQQLDPLFSRSTLQIATSDARLHTFKVWVADNDARRSRGLMFVQELADDAGMLFIYPQSQPVAMWMKNTHVPLDMLFVRANGRVERVAENTTPMSLDTIESGAPVLGVIELKAGSAARLNIKAGAQVIHPAFGR